MFLNRQMHLKSMLTLYANIQKFGVVRRKEENSLNLSQCCTDYCEYIASTFQHHTNIHNYIYIGKSLDMFLNPQIHFKSMLSV